jgi:hypothetical protein
MHMNKLFQPSVGADYGLSKNKTDGEIGTSTVTLSPSLPLRVNSAKVCRAGHRDAERSEA